MEAVAELTGRNQKEIDHHLLLVLRIPMHLTGQSLHKTVSPPPNVRYVKIKKITLLLNIYFGQKCAWNITPSQLLNLNIFLQHLTFHTTNGTDTICLDLTFLEVKLGSTGDLNKGHVHFLDPSVQTMECRIVISTLEPVGQGVFHLPTVPL